MARKNYWKSWVGLSPPGQRRGKGRLQGEKKRVWFGAVWRPGAHSQEREGQECGQEAAGARWGRSQGSTLSKRRCPRRGEERGSHSLPQI